MASRCCPVDDIGPVRKLPQNTRRRVLAFKLSAISRSCFVFVGFAFAGVSLGMCEGESGGGLRVGPSPSETHRAWLLDWPTLAR